MARSPLLGYWDIKGLVIVTLHGKISFAGFLGYQRVRYSQFIWLDLLCQITGISKG